MPMNLKDPILFVGTAASLTIIFAVFCLYVVTESNQSTPTHQLAQEEQSLIDTTEEQGVRRKETREANKSYQAKQELRIASRPETWREKERKKNVEYSECIEITADYKEDLGSMRIELSRVFHGFCHKVIDEIHGSVLRDWRIQSKREEIVNGIKDEKKRRAWISRAESMKKERIEEMEKFSKKVESLWKSKSCDASDHITCIEATIAFFESSFPRGGHVCERARKRLLEEVAARGRKVIEGIRDGRYESGSEFIDFLPEVVDDYRAGNYLPGGIEEEGMERIYEEFRRSRRDEIDERIGLLGKVHALKKWVEECGEESKLGLTELFLELRFRAREVSRDFFKQEIENISAKRIKDPDSGKWGEKETKLKRKRTRILESMNSMIDVIYREWNEVDKEEEEIRRFCSLGRKGYSPEIGRRFVERRGRFADWKGRVSMRIRDEEKSVMENLKKKIEEIK